MALALLHLHGDETVRDPTRGEALLRQAAKEGHAGAALQLGHLYRGNPQLAAAADAEANANIWYLRAAEAGDVEAQFTIATMYHEGKDVERDPAVAAAWFEKAAINDHAPSQFQLGVLLCTGQGVPPDLTQGLAWYERAAKLGHRLAQYNLAVMLAKGQGCEPDQERAAFWLQEAAERGLVEAKRALGNVSQAEPDKSGDGDTA